MTVMAEPDLFDVENAALSLSKAMYEAADGSAADYRHALGELIVHYQRLMRETRHLIRRSDRAELEMNQLNRQLQDLAAQLEYRATHDPLTGALNRGAVIEHASRCLLQGDVALIVLDIDHFKQVNDDFGHPAGDAVIQTVVQCLNQVVGINGAIGRVGGEEFSVVWPNQSLQQAVAVAQKICDTIGRQVFAAPIDRRITASIGVSWNRAGTDFEVAYGCADEALYDAKRSGRNRVKLAASVAA